MDKSGGVKLEGSSEKVGFLFDLIVNTLCTVREGLEGFAN